MVRMMIKLLFMMVLFVGFAYFGSTVQLGDRTLFGHLHAIGSTEESKKLVDGTKQSAKPLVDDVRRRIAGGPGTAPGTHEASAAASPDAGPPQESLTDDERRQLRRLIGSADRTASAHR